MDDELDDEDAELDRQMRDTESMITNTKRDIERVEMDLQAANSALLGKEDTLEVVKVVENMTSAQGAPYMTAKTHGSETEYDGAIAAKQQKVENLMGLLFEKEGQLRDANAAQAELEYEISQSKNRLVDQKSSIRRKAGELKELNDLVLQQGHDLKAFRREHHPEREENPQPSTVNTNTHSYLSREDPTTEKAGGSEKPPPSPPARSNKRLRGSTHADYDDGDTEIVIRGNIFCSIL